MNDSRDSLRSRGVIIFSWLGFLGWFLLLNVLSSIPNPQTPDGFSFPMADKVVHFLLFFAGSFLLANASGFTWRGRLIAVCAVSAGILILFGVADEFRQLLVPGRSGADYGDMIANSLGAVFGSITIYFFHGRFVSKSEKR